MAEYTRINTKAGEKFSIEFPINSTGFAWKPKEPFAPLILLSEESKPSESMGGQGSTTFFFQCDEKGMQQISFSYKRPWESSPQDQSKNYVIYVE
jgi:predicted secreted protein